MRLELMNFTTLLYQFASPNHHFFFPLIFVFTYWGLSLGSSTNQLLIPTSWPCSEMSLAILAFVEDSIFYQFPCSAWCLGTFSLQFLDDDQCRRDFGQHFSWNFDQFGKVISSQILASFRVLPYSCPPWILRKRTDWVALCVFSEVRLISFKSFW